MKLIRNIIIFCTIPEFLGLQWALVVPMILENRLCQAGLAGLEVPVGRWNPLLHEALPDQVYLGSRLVLEILSVP